MLEKNLKGQRNTKESFFFEHEDEPNETEFHGGKLDELETYDFDLDGTDDLLNS